MKSLSEVLKEARAILRDYSKGEHSTWKPQAESFLQTLRGTIESHDDARKLIHDFCLTLRWGYQHYLGSSGGSSLKAQLEKLLSTTPTSAEYETFLSENPQEKLNNQTIIHPTPPSTPLDNPLQAKEESLDIPSILSMQPMDPELSDSSSSEDESGYSFPVLNSFLSFLCLGHSQEHLPLREVEETALKEDAKLSEGKLKYQ